MKKKIALLLCLAMVLAMVPVNAFAGGLVNNSDKPKLELVYMKLADGVKISNTTAAVTGGPSDDYWMKTDTIKDSYNVGDQFLVAIKLSGLEKLNTVNEGNGLYNLTTALKFNNDYIKIPTFGTSNRQINLSAAAANFCGAKSEVSIFNPDIWGYNFNSAATQAADLGDGYTQVAFTFAFGNASDNPWYKGAKSVDDGLAADQYVGAVLLEVKAIPDGGAKVIDFNLTAAGNCATSFGAGGSADGSYSANNATVENDMLKLFEIDSSAVDIFPRGQVTLGGKPTIDNTTPTYGDTLTANTTNVTGLDDVADSDIKYQWAANGADISGATAKTYKLTANEAGKTITVKVSANGPKGEVVSDATAAVKRVTLTLPTKDQLDALNLSTSQGTATKNNNKFSAFTTANGLLAGDNSPEATFNATFANVNTVGATTYTATFAEQNLGGYKIAAGNVTGVAGSVTGTPLGGTASVTGDKVYGGTVTAGISGGAAGSTDIIYTWKKANGDVIKTGNVADATLALTDKTLVGTTITLEVTAGNRTGTTTTTFNVGKKALSAITAAKLKDPISVKLGSTVEVPYTFVTADGLVGTDVVTIKGSAAPATGAVAGTNQNIDVNFGATLEGTDAAYYTYTANKVAVKGTVTDNTDPVVSIKADSITLPTYTYGDKLNKDAISAIGITREGHEEPIADLFAAGYKAFIDGTEVANDVDLTVTAHNGKAVVFKKADVADANAGTLTVNKATATLEFDAATLTQTVGDVKSPVAVVKPTDPGAGDVTIEVKIPAKDAVDCTCPEGNHDLTSNPDCPKAEAVVAHPVAWGSEEANAYIAGLKANETFIVQATSVEGANTLAVTTPVEAIVTLKAKSTGGGGGSSAITVTFRAGTNGKITDGKASVSVNRNAKLTSANVPTVTANDGFKFLGWSTDGKTVVDPTKDAVTKSITYTALYEEVKGGHEAYMFGYADGTFQPNAQITRAEAAALMARLNPDYDLTANYTGTLKDLPVGAWFTKVVNFNVEKGFITGYTDGTFKPNNAITRQEFCTIVAKYLGLENTGDAKFTDTKGVYAEGFIAQLVEKNIVSGYNDGSFKPNANITRAEATRILNGVFGRTPNKETVDAHIAEYTVNLKDVPATHWAYYEILEAAINHTPADFHK